MKPAYRLVAELASPITQVFLPIFAFLGHAEVKRRKLNLTAKFEIMSHNSSFKRLDPGAFNLGFDRVNLHRHTEAYAGMAPHAMDNPKKICATASTHVEPWQGSHS